MTATRVEQVFGPIGEVVDAEKSRQQALFDEYSKAGGPEDAHDVLEPEYSFFTYDFPNLVRGSFVVSAHSAIESSLNQLCDLARTVTSSPRQVTDKPGSKVGRALKYLEEDVGIPIDRTSAEYKELGVLQHLRHAIVHAGSCCDNERLRSEIKSRPRLLSVDAHNRIHVTQDYCVNVARLVYSFLYQLLDVGQSTRSRRAQDPEAGSAA